MARAHASGRWRAAAVVACVLIQALAASADPAIVSALLGGSSGGGKSGSEGGSSANTYTAAYHYVVCEPDYVVHPANTQEVADAVKHYRQLADSKGAQLKIRASRNLFHSSTSFVCPNHVKSLPHGGPAPSPSVVSLAILHERMNYTIAHDPKAYTMRVGAGMKIRELTAEATRLGMSVYVGALPAYAGLTLGGIIATSAHGSGDNATSNICDNIISFTWVDVDGNVRKSARESPEGHMFCGGLGLIGIITEIELQMTPTTHTKLITRYLANDTTLVDDIDKMLKISPHILVFWRPDMRLYSAYLLNPVSANVPASDAYMSLLPSFKDKLSMQHLFETTQRDTFSAEYPFLGSTRAQNCPITARNSVFKTWASNPDGSDVLYTVAKTNNLVASECWEDCAWNSPVYNGTTEDVHLSIEWADFHNWVQDIRNIFQYDLWDGEPNAHGACLGPGYIWLRFGHATGDYLSMHYDRKRPVYVQSTWLKSRNIMETQPISYGFVLDLLEEVSLCKYKGRPHWGKNFARTFTHPKCMIPDRFPKSFNTALEMQAKHDPNFVFEPELFNHVRKGTPFPYYPRCAGFDKACYCQEDIHCPVDYRCVHSRAPGLESYKICKPDWTKDTRHAHVPDNVANRG